MWKFFLSDSSGKDVAVNNDDGEDRALVVATRDHKTYDTKTVFFTNSTYGREMAQNGAYAAIGWVLHDGTDTTESDSGAADADGTNHVLDGDQNFDETVCVGVTVHNTTDEPNLYAEVTAVAAADLTCDGDVCPTGDETYVVAPAWTFSEPTGSLWVEDSTAQYFSGSKSLLSNNTNVGDIMQLINVNGENIDLSNFAAFTMRVLVLDDWDTGDSVRFYAHVGGALAGNVVYLEDYFPYATFDQWHYINIPVADMGLTSTAIDAILFENAGRDGPKSPVYHLDEIRLEASGTPIDFEVKPDDGTWFHVKAFKTTFVDVHDDERANATLPNLAYDQILGMTPTEGYSYKRYSKGNADPEFEARIINLMDLLGFPYSQIVNAVSDGTNTMLTVESTYPTGVEFTLKSEDADKLVFSIEDDFSQLLFFRISVQGYVETR